MWVSEFVCFCEKNDQKLDKNRRVFCMLVNVWFFSVHVTDYFFACDCALYCESVLVCWVRNLMYSLAGNSARVRISFVFVYYRYDFLTTEKKTRKNSHLLSFKWFWRSQFYSKVVLVIRFRVCFLCHSCCQFATGDARICKQCCQLLGWHQLSKFWTVLDKPK